MTAPAWLDRAEYPFTSRWVEVEGARLHYVDEGLGLDDLTLAVHDYGGPIGLVWALDRPASVRRLVLFNTWMWSLAGDPAVARAGRLLAGPIGRLLYERLGFSLHVLFRHAVKDRTRYTRAVHAQYAAPLRERAARHATWIYARELLGSSDWFEGLWRRREALERIPALLLWGTRDPALGRHLPRWRSVFRRAEVLAWDDVGHAPPEERGPESATAIARFLDRTPAVGVAFMNDPG